jgi:cob(I)alamin adenosyltransferase
VAGKRRRWDAAFEKDLGDARWAVDSLVPSITNRALPAAQVAAQWPDGKRRLDDLQSDLYRLGADIPTTERATHLAAVSGALGALQHSLEADVALRATGPDGEAALAASLQEVVRRRETLIAAIATTAPGGTHQS